MRRFLSILLLAGLLAGCASTPPTPETPVDRALRYLDAGEPITLRMPVQLLHNHDMTEQPYDDPQGYRPIPTYHGELVFTDRRLLFVENPVRPEPSWLSIPYEDIGSARASPTALLNYVVIWNRKGEADSFVVQAKYVRALHHQVGQIMFTRQRDRHTTTHEAVKGGR